MLRRAVGVIAVRFTVRHAQLRPSADGRVKVVDELTPSDLRRLALDGSREMLRAAMIVAGHACIDDNLNYSQNTIKFLVYRRFSPIAMHCGRHCEWLRAKHHVEPGSFFCTSRSRQE
jgi:hypothetical protein